jgi:4-hydroxy-tetrahydrodipicolinate synthase
MGRFGRVVTAMVTPFGDDGSVDFDATAALAAWLADNGSDALVVTGTTGEVSVLTDAEHLEVWRVVRSAVDVPVIGGSGSNDTAHAVELTSQAGIIGLDGVLLVTPYYNRPPQSGLDLHFRTVAAATDLPVMLYDIPVRSGRKIATEVLVTLACEVDNIVALKDAAGDPAQTATVMAGVPDDFDLYSGDDSLTLPLLAVGATGVVSVCSHWAGVEMGAMIDAFVAGDHATAQSINASLLSSYDFESGDDAPNPIPAKVMMNVLGQAVGQCRLPLGPPPSGLDGLARKVLDDLGRPQEVGA